MFNHWSCWILCFNFEKTTVVENPSLKKICGFRLRLSWIFCRKKYYFLCRLSVSETVHFCIFVSSFEQISIFIFASNTWLTFKKLQFGIFPEFLDQYLSENTGFISIQGAKRRKDIICNGYPPLRKNNRRSPMLVRIRCCPIHSLKTWRQFSKL